MKFEEQEPTDESSNEVVLEPEVTQDVVEEETKPMLDYDNIKSSKDIEVVLENQCWQKVWLRYYHTKHYKMY